MSNRHTLRLLVWTLVLGGVAMFAFKGLPWLWPQLFPVPDPPSSAALGDSVDARSDLSPELAMEVLRRTLASLGATGEEAGRGIELPQGRSGRDLELALRADPRLGGCEIYVTRVDDLMQRVRIFNEKTLLLQEDIQPWLPERPIVSTVDPPELGIIVIFRGGNAGSVGEVVRWRAPVALAIPPDAPHTVRTARRASWSSKGVVILVHPDRDLVEQTAAAEDASGILVEELPPPGTDLREWLKPLQPDDLFVLDASGAEGLALQQAAAVLGLDYVKRAAHLDPGDAASAVLARNLSVRRGYGLVTVEGRPADIEFAAVFVNEARSEGYALRFPVEVARQHGAGLSVP
jgi:hypothetical protein